MKLIKTILIIYVLTILSWVVVNYYSQKLVYGCSTCNRTVTRTLAEKHYDIPMEKGIVTQYSKQIKENSNRRTTTETISTNITNITRLIKNKDVLNHFETFYENVSDSKLNDSLIHQHRYKVLLNNEMKCFGKDIFLLVFVHISTSNFEGRHLIRSTFGSISNFDHKNIEYVFVLGQTSDIKCQRYIELESKRHKDIIQGSFIDSYRNLTYKLVFSLFWVNNFCSNATFVIKMDEDIIINVPLLVSYLSKKVHNNSSSDILECHVITQNKPQRRRKDKWYITLEEYPFSKFLPYCAGHSSIMSIDIVRKMYHATSKVPFLWLEDVYGSGFLSLLSNIRMFEPKCYINPVKRSLEKGTCNLFYINNLKNMNKYVIMWDAITSRNISKSCKC